MNYFVGIDWGICSPSICICPEPFNIEECQFHFFRSTKAQAKINVKGLNHYEKMEFTSDMQRYEKLAEWAIEKIPRGSKIAMEGYSFSSSGLIFNLAENTAILKYKLYKLGYDVHIIPPTSVKKFYTGKGNATKQLMEKVFKNENGDLLDCLGKSTSPRSDIIDSFAICKMCVTI